MKKKIFLAAALAAVTLFAACGGPGGNPLGSDIKQTPVSPIVTDEPSQPTKAPSSGTEAPAANTEAPAANTEAPAANTETPAQPTAKPTAAPAATPKPSTATSKPAAGAFDSIAGSWHSAATEGIYGHGELSLEISVDGTSSLGNLVSDGNNTYHFSGTTKTLSLKDGCLYYYDTYTYEDATYTRKN